MSGTDIAQNTASISKAKLATKLTSQPKTKKFSAAGQPAGITSLKTKMLGDNRYSPNPAPNTTATDPFASLPQFSPDKMHKLEHDDRSSSISDTDDSCSVQLDREKIAPKPAPGKKTRGRVRIQMEYIHNKLRRYTTFSKRKSGIMKKAYELSTLTGTQVMLLVASETGHVYTFATPKLQPMITSEAGKALIQTCLHQPDPPSVVVPPPPHADFDMRMSASGFEETDLGYQMTEEDFKNNMDHGYHVASTATPMPTILNAGPIVTIPHGMMPMPHGFQCGSIQDGQNMTQAMNPIMTHAQMPHIQPSPVAVSPHHSSPPPSYSPPHQPASPPRTSPYTPPSAHMSHQPVMMEELHSPSLSHHHGGVEVYDRSPSRSPINHHRYSHSPPNQGLYAAPNGSPPGIRL